MCSIRKYLLNQPNQLLTDKGGSRRDRTAGGLSATSPRPDLKFGT